MNKNVYDLADSILGSRESLLNNNENEKLTTKILPDVKEVLIEYFKLKLKYNKIIEKYKK